MIRDFLRAIGQIGDARFRGVLWMGVGLALALLAVIYAGFIFLLQMLVPDTVTIPWIGEVGVVDDLLSWGSVVLMIGLSVFLMIPVASAFTGFFLDRVVDAVEVKHYAGLPPATPLPLWDQLIDSANFFAILVLVNLLALVLLFFAGPLFPILFWALNGFLLGREYFTLVAMRRLGRAGAKALRARHAGQIWLAGTLMAAPLSIPIVNLLVPVLGVATFTHLYHRVSGRP
ncbi:EI24 domain-containing protein [Cereibacter sphaeroides]|uniref:EI24 domain-containing protein n=1 Tax=Cereibacter sphaeroides TaxID=1063 RepID=UPI001F3C4351|nr:EI24 domain-containing protein [Cereibacter sphaeroides]MCE6960189.1 EI24 domain-containing protein [Cereibacter sphaeroides]MCE6969251.1 EI24 domain-containing protein [Cereibacter sphaeroides]MCE6974800.1 EI24 domain-containing protein [Cereibacter sphaeroides]